MTVLSAQPALVELMGIAYEISAAVDVAMDDGLDHLDDIRDAVLEILNCPTIPRTTCSSVDAALQALVESGHLVVADDDGGPIEPTIELPR